MARTFNEYRKLFPALYEAVKKFHQESPRKNRGHGLDHDVAVAQMTSLIAPDGGTADKAWVAGMIHSTDRLVHSDVKGALRALLGHLPPGYFTSKEIGEIFEAAWKHDGANEDGDSLTLITLRDADRLVNIQPLLIVRSGQHYADIPAIELDHLGAKNPKSTYKVPCNVLDDLRSSLEWEKDPRFCLRLPLAVRRGEKDFRYMREFIERAEKSFTELGLTGVEL